MKSLCLGSLAIILLAGPSHSASDKEIILSFLNQNQARNALDYAISKSQSYVNDSDYHFLIGRAYQELKLNVESLQHYSESIALDRSNYKSFINRALVKGALGNLRSSTLDLRQALEINPKSKDAYLNLGFTLAAQNNPQKAIKAFTQALKLEPNFPEALRNRGITNHHLGNKAKACLDWQKSLQLKKDEIQSWVNEYCNQ
jgi:tetratricopeptide (TPR) repeat protein